MRGLAGVTQLTNATQAFVAAHSGSVVRVAEHSVTRMRHSVDERDTSVRSSAQRQRRARRGTQRDANASLSWFINLISETAHGGEVLRMGWFLFDFGAHTFDMHIQCFGVAHVI